ncbi:hypothetical protein [Ovoidimarina sediminis]|uniref:hypothetical protein n=1 Tax=Ovoidimarina sediminis TaxID=3079856 RepID=UPI00290654B7|nr:hypothetical protein [Rhodophyticola sp. MJ-SS7]MDU8944265.1 hypothetical protein [Rhodophyticola sp. MJ-SS7]
MIKKLAITLILFGLPGHATEGRTWSEAGDWVILIDPENGNGCFMEKEFDDATLVRMGHVPNRRGGFFAAYNAGWTELGEGKIEDLRFDFGDALFGGEAEIVAESDRPGGYVFFDNPGFIDEFAKRNSVWVYPKGAAGFEIDLKGTSAALAAVQSCQSEQ